MKTVSTLVAPVNPMAAEGKDTVLEILRRDRQWPRPASPSAAAGTDPRREGWGEEARDGILAA